MKLVSIICPIYNEELLIDTCIQSVLQQDIPREQWELLLVDGESTDGTRRLIQSYVNQYDNIHLIDNPHRTVPYAMNIGIRAAQGEYICRIDAHSSFPANYISTLLHYISELPNAANVGAVCKTEPRNNSTKAKAIAAVLSNRIGVGGSSFRIGVDSVTAVDTVPFGFFRRTLFDAIGGFNESLTRNQDIEFNKRIHKHGGVIYLVPDTYCTYYARDTYKGLASNNYGNGKWNLLTIHYTHNLKSLSVRHFVPLLFVLSLLVPVCLMPIWAPIGWCATISLAAYLLLITIVSCKEAMAQGINFFSLMWAFIVLHCSYGTGSLAGLLKLPFLK